MKMAKFCKAIFKISIILIVLAKIIDCSQLNGNDDDSKMDQTMMQRASTLQGDISHEFSHLLGLATKSRRQLRSVTDYYTVNRPVKKGIC